MKKTISETDKILTVIKKKGKTTFKDIKRSIAEYNAKGGTERLKNNLDEMVSDGVLALDESGCYTIKNNAGADSGCRVNVPFGKNVDIVFNFEWNSNGASLYFNGSPIVIPETGDSFSGSNSGRALGNAGGSVIDDKKDDFPFDMSAPFDPESDNDDTTTSPTTSDNDDPF